MSDRIKGTSEFFFCFDSSLLFGWPELDRSSGIWIGYELHELTGFSGEPNSRRGGRHDVWLVICARARVCVCFFLLSFLNISFGPCSYVSITNLVYGGGTFS